MPTDAQPDSSTTRARQWFALGSAAASTVALLLYLLDVAGPWQNVAVALSLLTIAVVAMLALALRDSEHRLDQLGERANGDTLELARLRTELERCSRLEQELRQAKQATESAMMAKGEFLATMSHEIRTPLNGIVPMLDMLMQARLAPDHAELVRTAFLSSQQMLRIVDDILDYSKLEADRLELETTGFNLRDLLETVLRLLERPAQGKGLRLNLQIDPSVRLPVRGDPVRLRQVLGNLVSNAVKFTERGTVTVAVQRTGETGSHHQLRFEVRDTGIGISTAAQQRLFQAFSQADASTTRLYGGTGLGLAISKRIVDLMGGRIGVESTPGNGSTFWFEVPMLKVLGDMSADARTPPGGRLLLLSTDARLRGRLDGVLRNWGLQVTSVENTHDALDRLRTAAAQGTPWQYSFVLADLAGMRSNTALALYRNLGRKDVFGELRLVCLYGDDPVPDELRNGASLLHRQAEDGELRAVLSDAPAKDAPAAPTPPSSPEPSMPQSAATAVVTAADTSAPPVAKAPSTASARGMRVLLVEDNPVNLMVGQRLLGVLGIECETANNGEIALQRLFAARYDAVLMDCQMPVMDGYTATTRWRQHEAETGAERRLPIIAMTANAMAGDRQKCLDVGMDDYLPKPVTRDELSVCLDRWADRRQTATPPPPEGTPVSNNGPAPDQPDMPPPSTLLDEVNVALAAIPDFALRSTPQAPAEPGVQPQAEQSPALKQEIVDDLREMLGGEVDRLIDIFLEDTPRLVSRLQQAAPGPDFTMLRDTAHSLKSSSANLGAMALSAAASRIELASRTQSLDQPVAAVSVVVDEFERVKPLLMALRQQ